MKKALLAGSFDPPTRGHVDLILRSAKLCDHLQVAVGVNTRKTPLFSLEERLSILEGLLQHLSNVEVTSFTGLAVDHAKITHIHVLIRGLRSAADLRDEVEMAAANRTMSGIDTVFLIADDRYSHISSSLIREIAASGRYLEHFVPEPVVPLVYQRIRSVIAE